MIFVRINSVLIWVSGKRASSGAGIVANLHTLFGIGMMSRSIHTVHRQDRWLSYSYHGTIAM